MRVLWLLLGCAIAMTLVQDAVPGVALYHDGWYNALIAAFVIVAAYGARKKPQAPALAIAGAALVALAGVIAGLAGPDTETIVGAPGTTVQNADYGAFVFPLDTAAVFGRSYRMNAIVWGKARKVVHVDASDARGNHLTMTQPTNASFLSPVLMMTQSANIGGMNVAVDSFSVPAMNRDIRAVLFTAAQAAQLTVRPPLDGPAVLFDVADSKNNTVRGGIGIVPSGGRKTIGGIQLAPRVETYPAIVAAAAPNVILVIGGLLIFAAGAFRSSSRSRT